MEKIDITIPEGVNVTKENNQLTVSGEKGSITRGFKAPSIALDVSPDMVHISTQSHRKKDRAVLGTIRSRVNNMITGVKEGFEYKLRIYYAHFPMTVAVEKDKKRVKIDNFLGEKFPRFARIVGDTDVQVSGDLITVTGPDKESVGQTSANLEQTTRISKRDLRVFQDGIYLFEKNGVKLK
ncbi:MAG: 50S ribosomal protein L6 [Theionarchaea archaeon]|nr:50S ribosomal protein L6 [Theionarchaea archaeon]